MERGSRSFRLRLPGTLASREHALDVVAKSCRTSPAGDLNDVSTPGEQEFEFQTVSAVGEAFNNIVLHGYRPGPPGEIEIEIESTSEQLLVLLMDTGHGFEPKRVEQPLGVLPESGMGIHIINAWMDEVEYSRGPPNTLRLVKFRRPQRSTPPEAQTRRHDHGSDPNGQG